MSDKDGEISGEEACREARMLEFVNVSKSFWTGKQRKVILDRASFRVELGNSIGILAPNGTGNTTVVNMMAGLEKPDEGEIVRTSRISFPLGFMGGVVPKHTATENCRYIARLYALDPDYIEAFCRYLCGLKEYFDMPVGTYSQGMKARFTFALMLALEFDIYPEGSPENINACRGQPPSGNTGKILSLCRRSFERQIAHVRLVGRGEKAL